MNRVKECRQEVVSNVGDATRKARAEGRTKRGARDRRRSKVRGMHLISPKQRLLCKSLKLKIVPLVPVIIS